MFLALGFVHGIILKVFRLLTVEKILYDGLRIRRWLRLPSTILGNESNKCNPYVAVHILTKFNLSSGFPDGRSPGERKADAGKPKG